MFHQILELIILVLERLEGIMLQRQQQVFEGYGRRHLPPQRQSVDKHTDHPFQVRVTPAAHRGADDNVFLAADFGKPGHKHCRHRHEERGVVL